VQNLVIRDETGHSGLHRDVLKISCCWSVSLRLIMNLEHVELSETSNQAANFRTVASITEQTCQRVVHAVQTPNCTSLDPGAV
jgi:hypothetical protein